MSGGTPRTATSCGDLITQASTVYNNAVNSPTTANAAITTLTNSIGSLSSLSCSQSQIDAVIDLEKKALAPLKTTRNNIRQLITGLGKLHTK